MRKARCVACVEERAERVRERIWVREVVSVSVGLVRGGELWKEEAVGLGERW